MDIDRLGRRRQPDRGRGLRSLHPRLPEQHDSRAIRVAMSAGDWSRLDALVAERAPVEPTHARALGAALSGLLNAPASASTPGPLAWLDWERRKTLRLLRPGLTG